MVKTKEWCQMVKTNEEKSSVVAEDGAVKVEDSAKKHKDDPPERNGVRVREKELLEVFFPSGKKKCETQTKNKTEDKNEKRSWNRIYFHNTLELSYDKKIELFNKLLFAEYFDAYKFVGGDMSRYVSIYNDERKYYECKKCFSTYRKLTGKETNADHFWGRIVPAITKAKVGDFVVVNPKTNCQHKKVMVGRIGQVIETPPEFDGYNVLSVNFIFPELNNLDIPHHFFKGALEGLEIVRKVKFGNPEQEKNIRSKLHKQEGQPVTSYEIKLLENELSFVEIEYQKFEPDIAEELFSLRQLKII